MAAAAGSAATASSSAVSAAASSTAGASSVAAPASATVASSAADSFTAGTSAADSLTAGASAADFFSYEQRRRERVVAELDKALKYRQAAAVKISVRPEASYQMEGLPAGIHLKADELSIEFKDIQDLLSKLYELGQTIANDFERFRIAVQDKSQNSR